MHECITPKIHAAWHVDDCSVQARDPHEAIHWINDNAQLENQTRLRVRDPMYGRVDLVCPPYRPVSVAS
jgi:hypothetical protein